MGGTEDRVRDEEKKGKWDDEVAADEASGVFLFSLLSLPASQT